MAFGSAIGLSLASPFDNEGASTVGLAIGLINGFLVAYADVPAIFVTLASGYFVYGFARSQLIRQDATGVPAENWVLDLQHIRLLDCDIHSNLTGTSTVKLKVEINGTEYAEAGAGKVLSGMAKRIAPDTEAVALNGPAELEAFAKSL